MIGDVLCYTVVGETLKEGQRLVGNLPVECLARAV
jgi:hypothetical protein